MKCTACDSEDIEDLRELIEDSQTAFMAILIRTEKEQRRYDIHECRNCGHLMWFRRKKELQEITSEDVGEVEDILNPI